MHVRVGLSSLNSPALNIEDAGTAPNTKLNAKLDAKDALAFGGEFGHDFGDVRIGVEVGYTRHKITKIGFRTLNGRDIPANSLRSALVGVGIPAADLNAVTIADNNITAKSGSFAKLRQVAVLANMTYDIPVGDSALRPYVGAGIGGASTHLKSFGESDSSFRFAWQVRAGAAVRVTDNIELTGDYSYRNVGKGGLDLIEDEDTSTTLGKTRASIFQVGVRLGF